MEKVRDFRSYVIGKGRLVRDMYVIKELRKARAQNGW